MLARELPNLLTDIQQPVPLLDVESNRHPLQAVDADGPLLADLALQRSLLRLFCLLQRFGGLFDGDFADGDFGQDLFFGHSGLPESGVINGWFDRDSAPLFHWWVKGGRSAICYRLLPSIFPQRLCFLVPALLPGQRSAVTRRLGGEGQSRRVFAGFGQQRLGKGRLGGRS